MPFAKLNVLPAGGKAGYILEIKNILIIVRLVWSHKFESTSYFNPRPPEPFSVTRPPKGGGVVATPSGFSIINDPYPYVCYHCMAKSLFFPLIPK